MNLNDLQVLFALIIGFVIGVFVCALWYGHKYDQSILKHLKKKNKI